MIIWLGGSLIVAVFVHIGVLLHLNKLKARMLVLYALTACTAGVLIGTLPEIGDVALSLGGSRLHVTMRRVEDKAAEVEKIGTRVEALAARVAESERKLTGRRLSKEQREAIASKLVKFKETPIGILLCPNTGETFDLASDIRLALAATGPGWPSEFAENSTCGTRGIAVYFDERAGESLTEIARAMIDALTSAGLVVEPAAQSKDKGPSLMGLMDAVEAPLLIVIGQKP